MFLKLAQFGPQPCPRFIEDISALINSLSFFLLHFNGKMNEILAFGTAATLIPLAAFFALDE